MIHGRAEQECAGSVQMWLPSSGKSGSSIPPASGSSILMSLMFLGVSLDDKGLTSRALADEVGIKLRHLENVKRCPCCPV